MDWFHVTGMVSTWRWLTWGCRVNSSKACSVAFLGSVPPQPDEITALEIFVVVPPKLGSPPPNIRAPLGTDGAGTVRLGVFGDAESRDDH